MFGEFRPHNSTQPSPHNTHTQSGQTNSFLDTAAASWPAHLADVHVREVGDEVVANQKAHEDPVIDNPLQVVSKRERILLPWTDRQH